MKKFIFLVLVGVMTMSACASSRGVSIGTDQPQSVAFSVSVRNSKAIPITLTWIDGNGSRILGTLQSGETRPFSVNSSGSLRATDSDGGTIATKSVTYGNTKNVTF